MRRQIGAVLVTGAAILAAVVVFGSFYTVGAGERGIVFAFRIRRPGSPGQVSTPKCRSSKRCG